MPEIDVQVADLFPLGHFKKMLAGYSLPQTSFDPLGAWKNSYDIVMSCSVEDAGVIGACSIERIPVNSERARFLLKYRKIAMDGSQAGGNLRFQAEFECVNDELSTPINWEYESTISWPSGNAIDDVRMRDSGTACNGVIKAGKQRTRIVGQFALSWGLMDAVQRFPHDKTFARRVTLIDRLNNQIKPNHSITFRESVIVDFGKAKVHLHAYDHTGAGAMPTVYWVDNQGRLLFIISGLIAYVYNDGAEV